MPAIRTNRDGVNIIEVGMQGVPGTDAPDNAVVSDNTGITGADRITNMVSLTQAEYDAIGTPDPTTYYVIVE